MKPSLTILVSVINGQEKLSWILPGFRDVADQLVVCIDDNTTDDSARVARQYADTVLEIPHSCFMPDGKPDYVHGFEFALPCCKGDWILRLDHDETLGPGWQKKERIAELLSDRFATHYWIPRRWVVPPGDRYISSNHWYPDYQLRLFRNIPSLLQLEKILHQPIGILGEARHLTHEWILHWDLVWHSRKSREGKVRFYSTLGLHTGSEFYLYEEQRYETQRLDYVPPGPTSEVAQCSSTNPLACSIQVLDVPRVMRSGRQYYALISVQNLSSRVFHPGSSGSYAANVRISYHWYDARGVYRWDHARADLPARLAPGQSVIMYLPILELAPPGSYWLQADVVEEGLAWASELTDLPAYPIDIQPDETDVMDYSADVTVGSSELV